jgi:hypothetical protein
MESLSGYIPRAELEGSERAMFFFLHPGGSSDLKFNIGFQPDDHGMEDPVLVTLTLTAGISVMPEEENNKYLESLLTNPFETSFSDKIFEALEPLLGLLIVATTVFAVLQTGG